MRVISGEAKNRKLNTLDGDDTRPTTERVKEALFSIIQFDIPGSRFLDLYAGSGQIGIEALSRGAAYAVLNDQNPVAQQLIKENLTSAGLFKKSRVLSMDAESYLASTKEVFNIAYLDPPYNQDILPKLLPLVAKKMSSPAIIICEHEKNDVLPENFVDFPLKKSYKYGKIYLSVYRQA